MSTESDTTSSLVAPQVEEHNIPAWSAFRRNEAAYLVTKGYVLICVNGVKVKDGKAYCTCGGYDCKPGKHTFYAPEALRQKLSLDGEGNIARMTTVAQVHAFFDAFPDCNYGIMGGVSSDPDFVPLILDLDVIREGKNTHCEEWLYETFGQEMRQDFFHVSPSNGKHFFYRVPRSAFSAFIDGVSKGGRQIFQQVLGHKNIDLQYASGKNGFVIGTGSVTSRITGLRAYTRPPNAALPKVSELNEFPMSAYAKVFTYLQDKKDFGSALEKLSDEDLVTLNRQHDAVGDTNGVRIPPAIRAQIAMQDVIEGKEFWMKKKSVSGMGGKVVMKKFVNYLISRYFLRPDIALPVMEKWNSLHAVKEKWTSEALFEEAKMVYSKLALKNSFLNGSLSKRLFEEVGKQPSEEFLNDKFKHVQEVAYCFRNERTKQFRRGLKLMENINYFNSEAYKKRVDASRVRVSSIEHYNDKGSSSMKVIKYYLFKALEEKGICIIGKDVRAKEKATLKKAVWEARKHYTAQGKDIIYRFLEMWQGGNLVKQKVYMTSDEWESRKYMYDSRGKMKKKQPAQIMKGNFK